MWAGVEELQAAELYERDVPACEFDFEWTAVAGCPEQHSLFLQEGARLAVLQDAFDDEARLVGLVADSDELRLGSGRAFSPEVLGKALLGEADDAVGGGENRLRRAIVSVERNDACRRRELVGKVEDVSHGRGAKRINRLGVVADHRQASASRLERQQDRGLQAVRVLILVNEDVIEAAADVVGKAGVSDHLRPVEEEVVIVEDVLLLLGFDVGREEFLELCRPAGAPWIQHTDYLLDRHFGVDATGVDREARPLGREAAFCLGEALLMPDQVHEVRGVFAVVNREGGVQADLFGVLTQQPRADAVVGAGPGQRVRHDPGIVAHHLAGDAFDPLGHLGRGAP
jgi:hypothetical protein